MVKLAKQPAGNDTVGWLVLGGVIAFILLVGQCSDNSETSDHSALMNASNAEMGNAIAAQGPPPIQPLSEVSVGRGISHLRLAVSAEGFSGAMIYSQNCYDALTRKFSWAKLDQCGGADMLAVRSIENIDTAEFSSESAYFQSEAAAGRYLAAATGAGQPPTEADTRLSQLETRAARARPAVRPVASSELPDDATTIEADDNSQLGNRLDNIAEPDENMDEAA
jgi:hypothetical protein